LNHGLLKHEKFIMDSGCPAKACEEALVTVPVEVRAFAEVQEVELTCVGSPVINRDSDVTPGCPGAVSKFTISQKLRVEIPIIFRAETEIGQDHVVYSPCEDQHCNCCE